MTVSAVGLTVPSDGYRTRLQHWRHWLADRIVGVGGGGSRQSRGRSASLVHACISLALVVVVVAVAYSSQAPSLGIAEFSPSAQQQVEAPPTTTGDSKPSSSGGRGRATTTTQPTATATTAADDGADAPATSIAARGRQCFGDPPRQLPDPRSPSCAAAIFEGPNGGSTAPGVTDTEIRVAWVSDERSEQTIRPIQALFDYFNSRFELYGRRLVLVPVPYPSSSNPVGLRAAAAEVAAQGIFAAFEPSIGTFDPAWFNELARQQVIGITSNMWSFLSDRETYDPLHPYVWGVHPSMEQMWNNLASLACSSLVGRPASHAGSAYTSTTRKFGILSAGNERAPSVSSLTSQLSACGADVVTTSWVSRRDGSAGRATALNKLRDSGVTTFICACANQVTYGIGPAVDNMGWEPEWIFTGLTSPVFDEYLHQFGLPERQRAHLFGIQPLGMVGPQQSQWWWRAIVEAGVADVASSLPSIQRHVNGVYEQLLVLASGIQAAGPQLDASSFGQGLLSTSFPNTGAGAAPHFQESVGFGPGDHSLNSDFALVWWSMTATPFGAYTEAPRGSWCYLSGATRFKPGNYPTNADGLFFRTDLPCR